MLISQEKEARALEQTLASWFVQLGQLLGGSPRMRGECALTAFSVHPSAQMYERVRTTPMLPLVTLVHVYLFGLKFHSSISYVGLSPLFSLNIQIFAFGHRRKFVPFSLIISSLIAGHPRRTKGTRGNLRIRQLGDR